MGKHDENEITFEKIKFPTIGYPPSFIITNFGCHKYLNKKRILMWLYSVSILNRFQCICWISLSIEKVKFSHWHLSAVGFAFQWNGCAAVDLYCLVCIFIPKFICVPESPGFNFANARWDLEDNYSLSFTPDELSLENLWRILLKSVLFLALQFII